MALTTQTVKQNQAEYGLPLKILSYSELYGWTMDRVVEQVGKRNNCTYCGVFRRQALDRGAAGLDVDHIVTGHNADDIAETVLMNSEFLLPKPITHTSPARRRGAPPEMYGRHYPVGGHDPAVQAVQVCVREGDCHVGRNLISSLTHQVRLL